MPLRQPNVLVFFTDQQRADSTSLGGNPMEAQYGGLTPHFDRLARSGTYLANCCTCQPVCGPARAALQTGLYPTANNTWRNNLAPAPHTPMLGQWFQDAGYATAYIGKWHLSSHGSGPVPLEERGGYDYWLASNALEMTSDAYRTVMYDRDNQPVFLPGYRVDAQTDAAIRYLEQHRLANGGTPDNGLTRAQDGGKPFFLFLSYLEPHFQNHIDDYPPPDGYRQRYTRDYYCPPDLATLPGTAHQHLPGYYGMVKRLDEALGRLVDYLKTVGQLDNTIILFTSDHGCHFKTRNNEYKRSCHDSSLRIPTFIHGPGFMNGGHRNELVSLLDLPPTLLDAAGLTPRPEMQGRSLLDLLNHRGDPWRKEHFAQISESQVGRCLRTNRWKYSVYAPEKNGWKEGSADVYREEFLYDLQADPYELNNLIGYESHRELCNHLRDKLLARMVAAGEKPPRIEPADPKPAGQRVVRPEELNQ